MWRALAGNGGAAVSVPMPDSARGVYGISVAAELVGMGVQTLRLYEARGLLEPERTEGGTRRYSESDLDRLRRIGDLLEAGLNLAGVAMVIDLQDENTQLRAEKEGQQWLTTASIPATRSPKRPCSSSGPRRYPSAKASAGTTFAKPEGR